MKVVENPFFCAKKKCRKTAWDTPEYMTEEDWDFLEKVITVLETGTPKKFSNLVWKDHGRGKDFFNRVIGWPEGYVYCQNLDYCESTAFRGLKKHDLPKMKKSDEEPEMKKFKCFDCKREVECQPNLVLRQSPNSPGTIRVNVCGKCHKGVFPVKKKDL